MWRAGDRGVTMTERKNQLTPQYDIRVQGILDERWSAWFGGLEVRSEGEDVTLITGRVADQAALHGLLTRTTTSASRWSRFAGLTDGRACVVARRGASYPFPYGCS